MEEVPHGRILGLDGLRAIAAFIVVVYHLVPGVADVGYVGVDMFFVISGFLISSLLMKEYESQGSISIGRFWVRRIRRLVPAVVVATMGALALARVFGGDALTQLRWQALGAVTGSYNWLQIVHSSSYFDSQSPLLLNNMWSLAVEQQFYILWPPVLILVLLFVPTRARSLVAVGLAVFSIAIHALTVGADPTSAYVSTITHSFGLMMGAGLALSLPGLLSGKRKDATSLWGYASWVALVALLVLSFVLPDGWGMYPWGMVLFSALSVVIIRGILPDVPGFGTRSLQAVLEYRPIVWLGHRSYGIYLWHWPLHVIGFYHSPFAVRPTAIAVLLLSIACADISYRYIETPIRTQGFVTWLASWRHCVSRSFVPAIGFVLLLILSVTALVTERDVSSGESIIRDAQSQVNSDQNSLGQTESEGDSLAAGQDEVPEELTPTVPEVIGDNVTIIGDSVTVASQAALAEILPGAIIDGAVSRSVGEFPQIASQYEQNGQLRPYVVVALGTNAVITADDGADIMRVVGPHRRVVFVTASAPEYATWVPISNATMRDLAAHYPDQVVVADWQKIALEHPENLAGDRIHPDSEGAKLFADAVFQALHSFHA